MFGKITVVYTDGREAEYIGQTSDVIKFERHFGIPSSEIVHEARDEKGAVLFEYGKDGRRTTPKMTYKTEHLWFFAYLGAQRDGDERDFDAWADDVESLKFDLGAAPKARKSTRTRSRSASQS